MLLPNTRYKATPPFKPPDAPHDAFPGLRPRPIGPATGVVEHVVREGDRLDHMARHYYNDDRLWWRILDANPHILFGGGLMPVQDRRPNNDGEDNDQGDDSQNQTDDSLVGRIILIPRAQET